MLHRLETTGDISKPQKSEVREGFTVKFDLIQKSLTYYKLISLMSYEGGIFSGDELTSSRRRYNQGPVCPFPFPPSEILLLPQHNKLRVQCQLPDECQRDSGEWLRGLRDCRYRH